MSLSIKLKKEQLEYLEKLTKETGKTKDYYILEALDRYIDDLEKYNDEEKDIDSLSRKIPNEVTIAAMLETEQIINDPNTKYYTDVDELFRDLDYES